MLEKIVKKKISFFVIGVILLLALCTLTLIFGSGEDKIIVLVLSLILPFVIYGFVRLMFKIVGTNAPLRFMKFGVAFFFLCGLLGAFMDLIWFITDFPNGLSISLGCCLGLIISTLDEAKKITEMK